MEKLFTMKELSEYIGMKESTIYKKLSQKTLGLEVIKIGKFNRFRKSDVEKWLDDNRSRK